MGQFVAVDYVYRDYQLVVLVWVPPSRHLYHVLLPMSRFWFVLFGQRPWAMQEGRPMLQMQMQD